MHKPEHIIVLPDDVELQPGTIRVKLGAVVEDIMFFVP